MFPRCCPAAHLVGFFGRRLPLVALQGLILAAVAGVVAERVLDRMWPTVEPAPANAYAIALYYGEADGLTVIVEPGSDLRELGLMSTENRTHPNRIAEDFPQAAQTVSARTCLQYVRMGAQAALPLECRRGAVTVIDIEVSPLETFWYDETGQFMLPVQIMIGDQPHGEICQPEGGACRRSST